MNLIKDAKFDQLVKAVAESVAQSTYRVYCNTYNAWCEWCADNDIALLSFVDDDGTNNVYNFVASRNSPNHRAGVR